MLLVLCCTGVLLGLVGVAAAFLAMRTLGRLRRNLALLQRNGSRESFAQAVTRQIIAVNGLRREVDALGDRIADVDDLRVRLGDAEDAVERGMRPGAVSENGSGAGGLHRVALARYDAYPGMGGRMSWSVAMLDDAGSGLVMTAINSRSESRSYAKVVVGGKARQELSDEEKRVVRQARGKRQRRSKAPMPVEMAGLKHPA
ncbi:MAG: DUF4446 family protein [Mycobacteriales bacterium]